MKYRENMIRRAVLHVLVSMLLCSCGSSGQEKTTAAAGLSDVGKPVISTQPVGTQPPATTPEETTPEEPAPTVAVTDPAWQLKDTEMYSLLTGLPIDAQVGSMRPIAMMLSNSRAALPQCGISSAGIIYETPMEGGEMRFEAVFEDYASLSRIGSVRSARMYHPMLAAEHNAIFIHFGHNIYAEDLLAQIDHIDGVGRYGDKTFYRTDDRKAPHNAFTTPELMEKGMTAAGFSREETDLSRGKLLFVDAGTRRDMSAAAQAVTVRLPYSSNKPWFEYNAETNKYDRFQYDGVQKDGLTGEQLSVTNIIIQNCDYNMEEDNYTHNIHLVGSGKGYYITEGRMIPITWEKKSDLGMTRYYEESGRELRVNRGTTWICLVLPKSTGAAVIE